MSQLSDYILKARQAGLVDEAIMAELKKVGWQDVDINQGLSEAGSRLPEVKISPTLLDQQLPTDSKPKIPKKIIMMAVAVLSVVAVGVGAYYAYTIFFQGGALSAINYAEAGHIKYDVSYSETVLAENKESNDLLDMFFGSNNFSFTVKGEGDYKKIPNSQLTDGDFSLTNTFTVKVGGMSFNVDLETKKISDFIYYNLGELPFLGGADLPGVGDAKWYKFNLKDQSSVEESDIPIKLIDEKIKKIQTIWADQNFVKKIVFVDSVIINNEKTDHYKLEIDRGLLYQLIEKSLAVVWEDDSYNQDEQTMILATIKAMIDNSGVDYQIWSGQKDRLIRQAKLVIDMLPLMQSLEEINAISGRDSIRYYHATDIQNALAKYYKDKGNYPNTLDELTQEYGQSRGSYYLDNMPNTPANIDGCSSETAKFNYQPTQGGQDYSLTICFSTSVNDTRSLNSADTLDSFYSSPIALNSSDSSVDLPKLGSGLVEFSATSRKNISSTGFNPNFLADYVKSRPQGTKITYNVSYSNLGKTAEIKEPEGAVDWLQVLEQQKQKSRDAKRVSDIKQIQTALEMYYSDNSGYPVSSAPITLGQGSFKTLSASGWSSEESDSIKTTSLRAPVTGRYAFKLDWFDSNLGISYYDARRVIKLETPAKTGDTKVQLSEIPLDKVSYIIFDINTNNHEVLSLKSNLTDVNNIQLTKPLVGSYTTTAQIVPLLGSYWGHAPVPVGPVDLGMFQQGEEIKIGFITQDFYTQVGPFLSLDPKYFFDGIQPSATSFIFLTTEGSHNSTASQFQIYKTEVTSPYPINLPTIKAENKITFSKPYQQNPTFSPTSVYMQTVPSDPNNEGWSYTYCSTTETQPNECSSSKNSYMIIFQLEAGAGNFSAGRYKATPSGIEAYGN